jgi:two-component system cell cycle sensor histidine kinase/response regulator CckA
VLPEKEKPAMELLSTREAARFDLVRRSVVDGETLDRALSHALRLSAHVLGVARVGIWAFEDEQRRIRCTALYHRDDPNARPGEVIDLERTPNYAAALRSRRVVAADDVLDDPRTAELADYCTRNGIGALLDSPIFQQGEPIAIVCHEHVGPKRVWTKQDAHFVATVSDLIGVYLEQHRSQSHYRELIEARRALEEQRVMESLGRMAAAVAHDFNNVLAAVALKAELVRFARSPADQASHVNDLLSMVDQGSRLVRQLFDFARQSPADSEVVDMVQVIRGMEPLLRTFEQKGVRLVLRLPGARVPVGLSQSRLEQVVLNLATNARDAMLGGGQLGIEVALLPSVEGRPALAILRVKDTGIGMDEHTRERMFEPFFTTKPHDQSEGLGLATVYRIVTDSGGSIDVRSQPGAGTDFTVRWPLAAEP